MSESFNTETITHCGVTVKIDYFYDNDMGRPWEESDGHGIMRSAYSYYDKPAKKPGEVLIPGDRGAYWICDIQETTKIAKRDGWGVPNPPAGLTKNQITALAVLRDFEFCKGWLNGDWHYVGVVCTVLDPDGEETEETESCWGFESLDDYHETAGREMAEALAESTYKARLQQWRSALREVRARRYWASRDVVTVGAFHA